MRLAVGLAAVVVVSAISGCAGNSPNAVAPQKQAGASDTGAGSCATGRGAAGTCAIGNTGPGGGKVFYVNPTDVPGSNYMEAAPTTWSGGSADPAIAWCNNTPTLIGRTFGTAIGTGAANTTLMTVACSSGAANSVRAYGATGAPAGSWSLPSKDELNQLYINRVGVGGFAADYYWSSSQVDASNAWSQYFGNGFQSGGIDKIAALHVRPVRAF